MSRDNWIQTLNTTTDIGAERPIHKCGNPMAKKHLRRGRQRWACQRFSCSETKRRYKQSEKGREKRREDKRRYKQSQKGREKRREAKRRYHQLRGLSKAIAADPNRVLLSNKTHGLVELATNGATIHEREAARAALRKRGLL